MFQLAAIAAVVFAASLVASLAAVRSLRWARVLDTPNQRSSHTRPTLRGGGVAFVLVIMVGWTMLQVFGVATGTTPAVIIGAVAVAAVSFADDLWSVPLAGRFAVQVLAVAITLVWFPFDTPIVAGFLPPVVDRFLAGVAWLWFVNLFNFMDGIDGIAASEATIVALGLIVLALIHPEFGLGTPEAVVVGAAVLGFLPLNWPPARVFMGDVGSAALGFLLGWLLILAAGKGLLVSALLLPLYFLVDASTTLIARFWRQERLTDAHRDHAYQHAVDAGMSHATVTGLVAGLSVVLAGLAVLAVSAPMAALALGLLLTGAVVAWFRSR